MISIKNISIKTHPLTTVLGLLIALAALVSVFVPSLGIDWTEASVGILLGLGISGLKDPKEIGLGSGNGGGIAVLLFYLSFTALVSCAPPPAKSDTKEKSTIEKTDSTVKETIIAPKIIDLPSDSATAILDNPCPTIQLPVIGEQLPIDKTLVSKGNRNATATIRKNAKGQIECNCNCDKYQATIMEKNTTIYQLQKLLNVFDSNKSETIIEEKEILPWYAKWSIGWTILCFIALLIYILISWAKRTFNPFS
jgi:hypothetical protein